MMQLPFKKKKKCRVTICIPEDLERKLRLYQANVLLEEPRGASFSKIVSRLLTASLEDYSEKYRYELV